MNKSFLVFFFFSISVNFFAQGISVQGIARDAQSSAITDEPLTFTFSITQDDNTQLYAEKKTIRTDNYGVFSHIVKNGTPQNSTVFSEIDFSIQDLKMKVSVDYDDTTIEVYDQTFQYTPYAHYAINAEHAANGVPTGAIMPYAGADAPVGWVLCDGRSIENNEDATALKNLIGNTVPNLSGRFLKGVGARDDEDFVDEISLNQFQSQQTRLPAHLHGSGGLVTNSAGEHKHDIDKLPMDRQNENGNGGMPHLKNSNGQDESFAAVSGGGNAISANGDHLHNVVGITDATPIDNKEIRPSSYGVNYIIKL
jgi:microcystin-dependent protein